MGTNKRGLGDIPLADVPNEWRIPRRWYPKQCYERAFKYLLYQEGLPAAATLVHGKVSVPAGSRNGKQYVSPIGHAWVELPGDVVFDPVTSDFYEMAGYYEKRQAQPEATYEKMEMANLVSSTGHSGPWHKAP